MKILRSSSLLFLALLLSVTFFTTSCGEDREVVDNPAYVVDVAIISPADNATLNAGESFNVEVDYARADNIIHNIKVEILDASGNQMMKLVERHAHVANEFTFKMDNIQIDQAGTYTVRAATTDLLGGTGEHGSHEGDDHDKMENVVEHTITIQ